MAPLDVRALRAESELARRLQAHVAYLADPELKGRKPGTAGNQKAARYIEAQFRALSLATLPSLGGCHQLISPAIGTNVLGARLPDGRAWRQWILLGAHYDHLGDSYLGADDNASAVAILIETARLLGSPRTHPVLFAAFNSEEAPYIRTSLMGSQHFVDHLPSEIGSPAQFHAVIVMDLMGGAHWEPLKDTVFAAGAEMAPELYGRVRQANAVTVQSSLSVLPVGLHLVEIIPFVGQVPFSDYDAFRNAGVPFLFLSAGRTPRYHQRTDLPDTLHYERMAETVRWLRTLITLLDEDPEPYRFEKHRIEFADEVDTFRPLIAQAAQQATMIPGTSPMSLWKMKQDHEWIQLLNPSKPSLDDIRRLERTSIRMQCLLADFSGCFLI